MFILKGLKKRETEMVKERWLGLKMKNANNNN